ncbi:MAG: hypothetical protein E7335_07400 [Clostridiales bacterium]|nr:hypothetical protein [Clostridiales bacterium]
MKTEKSLIWRGYKMYGVMLFVNLVFALSMNNIFTFVFAVALLGAIFTHALNEGAYLGDKAVAQQEMLDRQVEEGKTVTQDKYEGVYNKKAAIRAFIITVLPMFLLALVNYIHLGSVQEGDANVLDWITTLIFMPFKQLFSLWEEYVPIRVVRFSYMIGSFIVPLAVFIGYWRGPVYHARMKKQMYKGSRKKKKNQRVFSGVFKDPNRPEL